MALVKPLPDLGALIEHDRVHGSLYTDEAIFAAELERIWYRTWVYVGHVSEVPEPNDYVLKSIGPAADHHEPRQAGRDPPPAQPLHAPREHGLRRGEGQLERLPLPVPRLDLQQHGQAARLPVQLRLRRARGEEEPRPRARLARRELPGVRVRLVRRGRPVAARAPRRRARGVRPPGGPVPDRRGRAHRRLAQAQGQGQLEDAARERDRRVPPAVRARVDLQRGRQRHRRSLRGEVDGRRPRPRQRPHRERPAPRVPPDRPATRLVRDEAGTGSEVRRRDEGRPRAASTRRSSSTAPRT